MDSKKVIEKLLKIATNQQKIIMRLAQGLPPDSLPNSQVSVTDSQGKPAATETPPASYKPAPTQKTPARTLLEALPPAVKQTIVNIEARGNELLIRFHPGKGTQPNYDTVLRVLQDLTNKNVIQQAYTLKPV